MEPTAVTGFEMLAEIEEVLQMMYEALGVSKKFSHSCTGLMIHSKKVLKFA